MVSGGFERELDALRRVFHEEYGFDATTWIIPSNESSQYDVMANALKFIRDLIRRQLIHLVLCGPRSYQSIPPVDLGVFPASGLSDRGVVSYSGLIRTSKIRCLGSPRLLRCGEFCTCTIQFCNGKLLLLVDLKGCTTTWGALFTTSLSEVLLDWKDVPSFSVTMLHCEVLRVLMQRRKERCSNGQKREWRSTPVYINGSRDPRVDGIRLCKRTLIEIVETSPSGATSRTAEPILPRDCLTPSIYFDLMSLGSSDVTFDLKVPHMLVSIALDEDQALPNAEACRRRVYSSYSTVVNVSIPVAVYNMLPDNPACQPVADVTSRNPPHRSGSRKTNTGDRARRSTQDAIVAEDPVEIKLRKHSGAFAQQFFHRLFPNNADEILHLVRLFGAFSSNKISEFSDKLFHAYAAQKKDWMASCRKDDRSWDPDAFRDILIRLRDLSVLVDCQTDKDAVVIQTSSEVLSWAYSNAPNKLKREYRIEGAIVLGAYLLDLRSQDVEISTRDKKHIQQCIDSLLLDDLVMAPESFVISKSLFGASQQIVWHLDAQGSHKRAAELCQIELSAIIDRYGERHEEGLLAMSNLSFYLRRDGQYERAEHYCRKALEGKSQVLARNHCETLRSMRQLANLLFDQGKLAEAEPIAKEAMARFQSSIGDGDPEVLLFKALVGSILRRQRKFVEALPIYEQIWALSGQILGVHHPGTLAYYNNYAFLLRTQGQLAEAEIAYRSIEMSKQTIQGEHHPDTLASMNNVAAVCQARGKFSEAAEHIYRKALEIRQKTAGKEHPQTLVVANNLAVVLQLQDKSEEAELLYRENVAVQERVLGKNHPDTMASLRNLVSFLGSRKKSSSDEPAESEVIEDNEAGE
ncbi:hypothetical protein BKA64DRAFT_649638 [Cadophora sp. MPI-SDFR-AT-0126]|nr:hypothetical protein BKA64DRAFT_649638 [Leotiomycetes sp. MPI-SDFR-AT-0126]